MELWQGNSGFIDLVGQVCIIIIATSQSQKGRRRAMRAVVGSNNRVGGGKPVGRFSVEFEVANNDDLELVRRGVLPGDQVRRQTISGVVYPGAAMLVLPKTIVKELGLRLGRKIRVRYADGRRAQRQEAKEVHVELLCRDATFDP